MNEPLVKYKRVNLDGLQYWQTPCGQDRDPQFLERWAAIYNLVRTIPNDRRFNMGTFGDRANTPCGTSACMAGHAMVNLWFHDRGLRLAPDSDNENLQFDQPEWFGLTGNNGMMVVGWDRCPFDPYWVRHLAPRGTGRLTPSFMSEVVMAWMLLYWPKDQVDAAIEATAHVRYSAKDVHLLTPWKGKKPGEEIPAEQEVKTA